MTNEIIESKFIPRWDPDSIEAVLQKTSWDLNNSEILTARLQHVRCLDAVLC